MTKYRSNNCGELTIKHINQEVKLSGWVNKKRDHGGLLFIDLRDHYGITQCVIENNNKYFEILEKIKPESVLKIKGEVAKRADGTENEDLKTGKIEVQINLVEVLSEAKELPIPVFGEQDYPEDLRLNIIKKIINQKTLMLLKEYWTQAYLSTPHGKPVNIKNRSF